MKDSMPAQEGAAIRELIDAPGATPLDLPAAAHDLNPLEPIVAKLEHPLRDAAHVIDRKSDGIDDAAPPPGVLLRLAAATPSGTGTNRNAATTPMPALTDPDARLARKSNGQASILAYAGHVLMEDRNGFVAHSCLTRPTGTAKRDAALIQ